MAKIHSIKISNFRGINMFEHKFTSSDFICLIGRGDSGKSTLLEAISIVLSANWNITFYDNDFHNCDTSHPIEIEVSLIDIPVGLLTEDKYGLFIRGLDTVTGEVHDEMEDTHVKVLTLRLQVQKDLEPKWFVVNGRHEPVPISAYDRAKFNSYLVSDFIDRHFSWNKGSPLFSLLKLNESSESSEENNVIVEALRIAKSKIDEHTFPEFNLIIEKIKTKAQNLGIDISNTGTSIDFKDLSVKDGRVCLHDEKIPFRLKGKGSKRLLSIAIQTTLASSGSILLIDEIEQGLEPDRVQHLVSTLKNSNLSQVFITTHSRDVLVELNTKDLFLVTKDSSQLTTFQESLQGVLRKNPEAFFAKKVIVCEGPTEIGICKAYDKHRTGKGKRNASSLGIRFADGTGSNFANYSLGFKTSNLKVCLFCDSDDTKPNGLNSRKEEIKAAGIEIIDWEVDDCLEVAILKNIPVQAVNEIVELAATIKSEESPSEDLVEIKSGIKQAINQKLGTDCPDIVTTENVTPAMLKAIGLAANKGGWFKNQEKGERFGNIIFKYFDQLAAENILQQRLIVLSNWMDHD